ncbi:uncharacterized protein [Miscanthus floridulus]|uniref:uncharacterized protein n=1 Tax=Miscanthus floridulus TaxID=154761 RepID=UPI0034576601
MAEHDLTALMAAQLDRHLVFPLLEFLQERQLYSELEFLEAKIRLLSDTNMVDYAMDIHKSLHGTDDVPEDMVKRPPRSSPGSGHSRRPPPRSSPSSRTRSSCRSSGPTNSTTSTCSRSGTSDGAAALVLVSGQKAQELGLQVLARIRGYADAAQVSYSNSYHSVCREG